MYPIRNSRRRGPLCQATRIRRIDGEESIRSWLENHPAAEPGRQPPPDPDRSGPARRPLWHWTDRALLVIGIILMLLLLLRAGGAQAASNTGPQDEPSWGLAFRAGAQTWRSVALHTAIDATITGMIARVDVHQRFRNTGDAWAEAVYRFPLPDGAAVDALLVDVAGRIVQGEIQEQQAARRQYQQARNAGKVGALIEQQRHQQFTTRLANVGPGEEIQVSISFLARVEWRDGVYSLQLPLTFTPRWEPGLQPDRAFGDGPSGAADDPLDDRYLTMNIQLRAGLDLARVESRYHAMQVHTVAGGYELFLADPDTRTDRVFQLDWAPDFGRTPQSTLMTFDAGDAVYALLMLAPPLGETLAPQAREVVFVIDTSGSMQGASLLQATAALLQGLDKLAPDDHFNLIQFNSGSEMLFRQSRPADAPARLEASRYVQALQANGGTNMAPALHAALALPARPGLLRQVVFITDGSVGNEEQLLQQIAAELGQSRLFTVSIGSAPNSGFMRKAATIGRGNHTAIGRLDEVEQRIASLWGRIQRPALQDICIDWGVAAEYYPELVPDLYAGEPLWLVARLPLEPREVTLCGTLNGQPWEATSRLLPGQGERAIATLWARSKIEALQDSRLFGQDAELIRLEVTALALQHGLLTPYTSLVAIDKTPLRPASEALNGNAIASLLPAGSSAFSSEFAPTATGWRAQILLSLACLLIASGLLWFSTPARRAPGGGCA